MNILVGHVARTRDEGWTTMIHERQVRSGKWEQGRPWQKWRVEIERSPGANIDTLATRETLNGNVAFSCGGASIYCSGGANTD